MGEEGLSIGAPQISYLRTLLLAGMGSGGSWEPRALPMKWREDQVLLGTVLEVVALWGWGKDCPTQEDDHAVWFSG